MMKKYWFTFLLLSATSAFFAQQPLELQTAINLMKENNTQLKIQQHEIELANSELSETLSGFLPSVSLSHTGFYTNDPLNAFGFKLQQQIVTQADFNPALLNNPDAMQHFNTKLSVQQPLLNFDVFVARKALREKVKAVAYQKQYAEDMLVVEIKKVYTNLQFLYEAKNAIAKGILAYEEVLRNTQNMQTQGYVKLSDVLMVQVGLSEVENRQIEIDNSIASLSDYLSWLMGDSSMVIYMPTQSLTQTPFIENNQLFSENRADVLAMKSSVEAQRKMLSMHKQSLLPRLNAFGEFNYQDKDIAGLGANAYMLGVSLTWDLFNGNKTFNAIKKNKININKAQTEMQLYIEKNKLELQRTKRDLEASQAKINLTLTAKNQAGEALRIIENRYTQGLEKTSDLLISQATELEKQVKHLEAIKDYNLSAIQIEFLTNKN